MAWSEQETTEIAQAFSVACEVSGTVLSPPARAYMLGQLAEYPAETVLAGLMRAPKTLTGKLTMAGVMQAIEWQSRKEISDSNARKQSYLTILRNSALEANIPWELGVEQVERELAAKGWKLEKMPGHSHRAMPTRSLPAWSGGEND